MTQGECEEQYNVKKYEKMDGWRNSFIAITKSIKFICTSM